MRTFGILIITLLLSGSLFGQVVKTDTTDIKVFPSKSKSPTGAMIRSVLFPGWGQVYSKHYVKGGLIFCLETGLILSAVIEDKKARDAYPKDYDEYLDRLDRRNTFIWWTAGVIVYSMIDAYVDAHLFRFDEEDVTLSLEQSPYQNEVQLVIWIPIPEFR